jgi:hypothetical protein
MAKDAELDRLKTAQDLAFQRKQDAYQVQQRAWERRSTARDALNRAHEAKQNAYTAQDASWQDYQRVRSYNGPRIDRLNAQQEAAFENMKRAFDNASSAHDRRDGASARSYADEGHRHKAESQGYVAERRKLVEEIRSARASHEATKPAFQRAKDDFSAAKRSFDQTKAEHERAQEEFKRAKANFDQAAKAFKDRLGKVQAESKRRKDDKRSLAEKAGVPSQYRDNVWVSTDSSGNTNIYFGGAGEPNGPGHGHYVMDHSGKVTYKRDPFDPHGTQNFQRDERVEREMARLAMNAWARRETTGRQIQYQDGNYTIKVGSGYSRNRDAITTDVIIAERNASDEHYHLVIDDRGNVVFSEWRKNH